jgi:hypothetical protein
MDCEALHPGQHDRLAELDTTIARFRRIIADAERGLAAFVTIREGYMAALPLPLPTYHVR